jgi:hypothetical protein
MTPPLTTIRLIHCVEKEEYFLSNLDFRDAFISILIFLPYWGSYGSFEKRKVRILNP